MRTVETMSEWEAGLLVEAIHRGEYMPRSWEISFDDGEDGCMPEGWYVMGLDSIGCYQTFPMRHEYGPYKSVEKAQTAQVLIARGVAKDQERLIRKLGGFYG